MTNTQLGSLPLESRHLRLRRFTEADLPTLLAYRNDPVIAQYQGWSCTTEAAIRAFIADQQTAEPFTPGPGFQFAIELQATGAHIGDCFFRLLEYDTRQGEIGYTLAPAYHGYGYATEAVTRVLDHAFGVCNLHRVIALTDCANSASIALLERLHMRREAHFRQSFWNNGQWRDEYQYAVLRDEWLRRARS